VTQIRIAPAVAADLQRFLDHFEKHDITDTEGRITRLFAGLDILRHSPLVGRPTTKGRRELVIGQGSSGYVALYRFDPVADLVVVIALRAQRERGFKSRR
jgi:plasmid stabilization system protein ParE